MNTINDRNEYNNDASRPILIGDFAIPGMIEISDVPETTNMYPYDRVLLAGKSRYPGAQITSSPPVYGGTVTYRLS